MDVQLHEFLTGLANGLVDAQFDLDERGRGSIDAFADTGMLPTVFTWSTVRVSMPLGVGVEPKTVGREVSAAFLVPFGTARLALGVRYLLAEQGTDDPSATDLAGGVR